MRSAILQTILFCSILLLSFPLSAQITITTENFQRPAEFIDTVILATQATVALPAEGTNQVWDYANLTKDEELNREYSDASSDPNFPDALNVRTRNLFFQVYEIPSNHYEAQDASGWYDYGRYIEHVGYSITNVSGGPADSLFFVEDYEIFEGRINNVRFPMTYQDTWEEIRSEDLRFELSVAAFGLNHVPGRQQRIITQTRRIVGYGNLIIPDYNGMPSAPLPSLLIKVKETREDSTFLAGVAAPAPLMAAFGLAQGATSADSFYVFYTPGFTGPAMDISINGNQGVNAFYHPGAAALATGVGNVNAVEARSFPNPVSVGQLITVQFDELPSEGTVSLLDFTGRMVKKQAFVANNHQLQMVIPNHTESGLHLLQINDASGQQVGFSKVLIK